MVVPRIWVWLRAATLLRRARKAPSSAQRVHAQRKLERLFGRVRGVPMKFDQMRSLFAGDVGPPASSEQLEPWPLRRIEPFLRRQIGDTVDRLEGLSEAVASASFGQVHRARLDGEIPVAVKVQYPDMEKAVRAELRWAGLLPGVGPMKKWGFDLDGYRRQLKTTLDEELDYQGEAKRQEHFRQLLEAAPIPGVEVPRVSPHLGARAVLIQEWHQGQRLDQLQDWRPGQRVLLGRQLLLLFCHSLFVTGELHADPNPGNYLFRLSTDGKPSLSLLDFGCLVQVDAARRRALLALVLAARDDDLRGVDSLWQDLGYDADGLALIGGELAALTRLIFRPFIDDSLFDVGEWRLSESVDRLLGERKWWFRASAPVDLLLVMRALHGLSTQLQHLQAKLPWYPLLESILSPKLVSAAEACRQAAAGSTTHQPASTATSLRVRVAESGEEVFALAVPAREALDLTTVVPDGIAGKLERRGVCLADMSRSLAVDGLMPQQLFCVDEGQRSYRVWLE